ncbi:hypothetical protein HOG48_01715 [Candidatus Peregrinibacteria bacterium]|jgi:hypothetical protein|nr:hypothetical protein [Candidatus Peregrinibacteria bacterium]
MGKTYKDLFHLNIKYIEYLLEKSLLSHQYTKNISISGSLVENEIREIFKNILPKRFHVTHGYIVSAESKSKEPNISPQIDMIVVDTLVPHSIFIVDKESGMEIVPLESVVGIFEIKRKIDKYSLLGTKKRKGAFEHIHDIISKVGVNKYNKKKLLPGGVELGGGLTGGYCANPIIGIIGLEHSKSLRSNPTAKLTKGTKSPKSIEHVWITSKYKPEIDIITSLDGFIHAIVQNDPPHNFAIANPREKKATYKFGTMVKNKERSQALIVSRAIGFILYYIQNTVGSSGNIDKYFFNEHLK